MRAYSRDSILAIEGRVISGDPATAFDLMRRAGSAAYRLLRAQFPSARRVQVLCGSGNNAGDGYVLAALAQSEARTTGIEVEVIRVGNLPKPQETALIAYKEAEESGVPIVTSNNYELRADVLVDALLGTGVQGAPRPEFATAIAQMNASHASVLSLDLPSGMHPDTGSASSSMVRADVTISFIGAKRGMLTGLGKAATGTLIVDRLGLSQSDFQGHTGQALISWAEVKSKLPALDVNAHKHGLGHLLVIGGDTGMGGAAIMAAESALYVGTGLVTLATRQEHVLPALARCPEVMLLPLESTPFEREHSAPKMNYNAVVIGPGLGRSEWGARLLTWAAASNLPMLVDGDGLALLREGINHPAVITPHPGEAARLLGCRTQEVSQDRFAATERLASRCKAVTLLKGAGSLVAAPNSSHDHIDICAEGNPGMATAGSGDVLAGIIGGFLAQGVNPLDATRCGACLHAAAGDLAAGSMGQRSLKATDLLEHLPELLRELG
ncbi:MAG: NAD(P)H-hydrate dehydratase [Gammaproteobacteria bacterium]|nr:NAD(P)H-hydrate dehydratase [Gammaproteobacteria bacterium]